MTSDSDEKIIFSQTWNKMKKSLHSEGFREGSSLGRDSTFQQGFDAGYSEGFQVGYNLGLHNGVLRCLKSDASSLDVKMKERLSSVEPLNRASRGLCVVCSGEEIQSTDNIDRDDNLQFENLTEIKVAQEKVVCDHKNVLLTGDYLSVLSSVGLDDLFKNH